MAGKGTRHRFELSRLEIAGVIVSATAGLFVVFLLGLYAGRGMVDRRGDGGEQIVRLPVAPAIEQTPGTEDGLTFYDTLGTDGRLAKADGGANERHAAPPVDDVPEAVPAETKPVIKAAEPAPAPKLVEPEVVAKTEKPAKPEPPVKVVKEEAARPASAPSPAAKPVSPSTARVAVALAPAAVPTPALRTGAKGDWSVQVSATRDPRTADTVLKRLRTKGYDAFVLKVRRRGETFYRVRVGHYGTLEEAQQVVSRLRREPGVPEAFVASD
ncbi:MAG: SPOR domain-containing protein [Candidatus Binatia bacterium]